MTVVAETIETRDISRVCHLTPFLNLIQMFADGKIRSIAELLEDPHAVYERPDQERYDGALEHVSCSIEYPNSYYWRLKTRNPPPAQQLAPDWAIVAMDPEVLLTPGIRFCPHNAGAGRGSGIIDGEDAIGALYASTITSPTSPPRITTRASQQLPPSPTDIQAEALLPGGIPRSMFRSIIAKDERSIKWIYGGLKQHQFDLDGLTFAYAPELFDAPGMATQIRAGLRPNEIQLELDGGGE